MAATLAPDAMRPGGRASMVLTPGLTVVELGLTRRDARKTIL